MTAVYAQVRVWALSFTGTFEDFPFGPETAVFKVQASEHSTPKVFALLWHTEAGCRLNLKCEPALAERLRETYPQITPGYHMNKKHWNSVTLPGMWEELDAGLNAALVQDLVEDSYDLVVSQLPRRDRHLLDWHPST